MGEPYAYPIGERMRVLYAEDYGPDADLTRAHFDVHAPDFRLEIVDTGERCLARLREAEHDVVLLDKQLPDMDAADILKEMAARDIRVPVVIVTGSGDEAVVVQLLRLGAWDYVPKQGHYRDRLPDVLRTVLREYHERHEAWDPVAPRSPRILYVEHNEADIDLTLAHFAAAATHLRVAVVRSSADALARLGRETFDLVLADLRMPDMSGLELLRESKHRGVRAPFILITGRGDEATAVAALKLGAYDYIVKRESYLTQLPHAIDHAIARAELRQTNARLQTELAERTRAEAARTQLAAQLQHAQKMESIGRLAAGVAHDFNNVLTAIIGGVQLALLDLDRDAPMLDRLREVERAGQRGAAMTHQLLAFSRRQVVRPRVLALDAVLVESTKLLRRLLGEDVELVTRLEPELGRVRADAGQIDQIVLNLAVNARDAMPRGGQLVLETRNVVLDDGRARELDLAPGAYVMLAVRDTGTGMDAATLPRIFEPFFTTKEPGKGTGLGLSTVYGIVKQGGGSIAVESEPGRGACFAIYLPRVEDPLEPEHDDSGLDIPSMEASRTLLVVEDDAMVRTVVCGALRKFGYQVIETASGAEALRACAEYPGPIALMLTDIVMPAMSARELSREARRLRPHLRILSMSGYTDEAMVPRALAPGTFFLPKPFTLGALARKVREVLLQPGPPVS